MGWLVPPDDLGALEAAVREALADPEARRQRGAAARNRVWAQGFERGRLAAAMINVFREGAAAVSPPPASRHAAPPVSG